MNLKPHKKTKWATFTYIGLRTKYITKIFRNATLKFYYKTNNTIQKLWPRTNISTSDKFDNCGIYQLTCLHCNKKYVGQTGGSFRTRYREYLRDFIYNSGIVHYCFIHLYMSFKRTLISNQYTNTRLYETFHNLSRPSSRTANLLLRPDKINKNQYTSRNNNQVQG
jgi:hypothetical protein